MEIEQFKQDQEFITETEIKEGIKYTTRIFNRPIKNGDFMLASEGTDVFGIRKTTEIINHVYQNVVNEV